MATEPMFTPELCEELWDAAEAVLSSMSDSYTARNGRQMGIQGDDGEKCWIVHSDAVEELRRAHAKARAISDLRVDVK